MRVPSRGRPRDAVPCEPRALVQRDARARGESPGEELHADGVVQAEAPARVRQGHHAGAEAHAGPEHLRIAPALGRGVVEEHDALGDRHRPGGPGDDRQRRGEDAHQVEEPQAVVEDPDVPAGDAQGVDARENLREFPAVMHEVPVFREMPLTPELVLDVVDAAQVVRVQGAQVVEGGLPLRLDQIGSRLPAKQGLGGRRQVPQADPVEALELGQPIPPGSQRLEERRIVVEHVVRALVQPEVLDVPAQMFA